jgi:hypothetical protein
MKLRIRGNSIRLRLTKSEVARFEETGLVEEVVEFGAAEHQRFVYALSFSNGIESPRAVYENNRILVLLPESQVRTWTQTNQVGISAEYPVGDNKFLKILIEKDFACLEERPGEDESDAFPHPLEDRVC